MAEKTKHSSVTGDSSVVLYNGCGTPRDGVFQFSSAVVAMHFLTQAIAVFEVGIRRCPDNMTCDGNPGSIALHARQMLAYIVAKFGIQRERSRVKASLNQADSGKISRGRALMHRIHQPPPDRAILDRRVDSNRPNTSDPVALVQKIAADDSPIDFCDDRINVRICQHS